MGLIKVAIGDALLTSMWVFSMPVMKIFTAKIATFLGVQALPLAARFISTVLVSILVITFSAIGENFGGASFNPAASLTFHAAGLRKNASFLSMAVRFPVQAAGGVAGVKAALEFIPVPYRKNLTGPSLKVDLHTGAIAEGVFTFVRSFALLMIIFKGPKNNLIKQWLVSVTTAVLVITGSNFTGAPMNPASAFGWAYVNNRHNSWELYYVYWIGALIGAASGAWVFRFLVSLPSPPPTKQKKA
ncbi:Detected protein of confused Function [Hibiscus syriacus]|uniref:Detected protein of confused Function n=1 Tax=Hibiscus syriacus TaxID=106335 RepID=A0A6A3BLI7_HIBSY|nr:aquaporin SIP1-1-like [Hibiscus syriacus]KAE8717856.1 Detected protein of confused Function [Hibiscus syriacus]